MKLSQLPPVGMRNIKTGLSVLICLVAFAIMGPQFNPFFACIAAVVCMGSSIEDSVDAGWNRILGTIIGGVAGILGIFICNMIPWDMAYMVLIPLGTVGLIYLCTLMNKPGAIIMCCVMFISVMTTFPQEVGSYMLAFLRLLETSFGVMVAFLVNMFIKVPDKTDAEDGNKTEEPNINEKKENQPQKLNITRILSMILKS
ncbi:MAG: FUSC family protein [Eubacteriaceae bacterium]